MSDNLRLLSPHTPPLSPRSPAATPPPPLDLYDSDIERWGGGRATDDDEDAHIGEAASLFHGLGPDLSNYKRRLSMSLNSVAESVACLPCLNIVPCPALTPPSRSRASRCVRGGAAI